MMAKTKLLRPSLREKKRYVAFEVISNDNLWSQEISNAIIKRFKLLFGLKGAAKAGVLFINNLWKPKKNKGVIKVNNKYTDHLNSVFSTLHSIEDKGLIIRSVGVSGTLKKIRTKYLI